MDEIDVPEVFSEFKRSLNSTGAEYLLIGGDAVALHGYPRPTEDLDVWVAANPANALVAALLDAVPVAATCRADLKANKAAAGRLKDLADLGRLP